MQTADALRIEVASVDVRHLTIVGTVPGVVPLLAAASNGPGIGQLLCDGSDLRWQAPGSAAFGEAVDCSADGAYVICDGEDSSKWIRVEVHSDYFEPGRQAEVALADVYNNPIAQADLSAAEALAGDELVYQLTLHNAGDSLVFHARIWCAPESDAMTAISLDGESWSRPIAEASGLAIANLAPSDSVTLFLRRTIPADQSASARQLVLIHIAFLG